MKNIYKELLGFLKQEDKENALKLCVDVLEKGEIGIVDLYEQILAKALNNIIEEFDGDVENLIWKEHVRSGMIRTIIESMYPYVLREKDRLGCRNKENVLVMCPQFEDHELGARMVADFFMMVGYQTTFIGANTPENTIMKAIEVTHPKYICMSITNHYNLVIAKKTIQEIKKKIDKKIVFLLGGNAFLADSNMYLQVGGDQLLKSFQDILELDKDVIHNEPSI